jgi:hypothetical protein
MAGVSSLPLGVTQLRSRELRNGTDMSGAPLPHTIWLEDSGFLRIFADRSWSEPR